MNEEQQRLLDRYQSVAYVDQNKLDGKFEGPFIMYSKMYNRFMPADKNAKMLDLACGAGQWLSYCKRKGYTNFTGVDICPEQVDYVKSAVTPNIRLGDALKALDGISGEYDLIISNDFIEHIDRWDGMRMVKDIYRALKPGGRIILKTGNMSAFGGVVMLYNDLTHIQGYTEKSMADLLKLYDFTNVEAFGYVENKKKELMLRFHAWIFKNYYGGRCPKCLSRQLAITGIKPAC